MFNTVLTLGQYRICYYHYSAKYKYSDQLFGRIRIRIMYKIVERYRWVTVHKGLSPLDQLISSRPIRVIFVLSKASASCSPVYCHCFDRSDFILDQGITDRSDHYAYLVRPLLFSQKPNSYLVHYSAPKRIRSKYLVQPWYIVYVLL